MKRLNIASSGSPNNAGTSGVSAMASKNIKAIKNTKAKINDKSKINTKANINTESKTKTGKHKTNWHEAAVCALKIELRDYAGLLDFQTEYVLEKDHYRIDLIIIKKVIEAPIFKNIAKNFKKFNIFEIKGIGSSACIKSYYKSITYAFDYITQSYDGSDPRSPLDVTITILSCHYPNKLINHLTKERGIPVGKISDGIYVVENPSVYIQLIITSKLPSKENLYLCCMTNNLNDPELINRLADDYGQHLQDEDYVKYLNQLANANNNSDKEENTMVCEGLLNLFGTSSEEIIANTKQQEADYYLPQINELKADNKKLASSNDFLTNQVNQLKQLLIQNNIAFEITNASETGTAETE